MDAREFKGIIYNTLADHQCKDQEDVWLVTAMVVDLCREAADQYCFDQFIDHVEWSDTI